MRAVLQIVAIYSILRETPLARARFRGKEWKMVLRSLPAWTWCHLHPFQSNSWGSLLLTSCPWLVSKTPPCTHAWLQYTRIPSALSGGVWQMTYREGRVTNVGRDLKQWEVNHLFVWVINWFKDLMRRAQKTNIQQGFFRQTGAADSPEWHRLAGFNSRTNRLLTLLRI